MQYICLKNFKSHNGNKYQKDQVIPITEWNNLTYREKTEHFQLNITRVKEGVGIGNDRGCEL